MFNKRGQAAMEFLMTYGWAILAAVIVVGVLWYMIGNPANLAGNNFQVSAPLVGNAMSIDATTTTLEIRNGASESITVTNITVGSCNSAPGASVAAGSLQAFSVACNRTSGDRVNDDVTISYTTSGSSVTQSATGSVTGRVP